MKKAVVAVSAVLVLLMLPGVASADPMDDDIVCVVEVGPGGQYESWICVDASVYQPRSHIIVCPPTVVPPVGGSYYCVTAPFP